jgi:hypothetical protein
VTVRGVLSLSIGVVGSCNEFNLKSVNVNVHVAFCDNGDLVRRFDRDDEDDDDDDDEDGDAKYFLLLFVFIALFSSLFLIHY